MLVINVLEGLNSRDAPFLEHFGDFQPSFTSNCFHFLSGLGYLENTQTQIQGCCILNNDWFMRKEYQQLRYEKFIQS